ncbi:MAG: sigma-70 family RNA polymerase sigma factor [Planctomycetes bacterium]|nr:sigma-70 family RNA polymerase sigma factor [Planctomycetota bacterium]
MIVAVPPNGSPSPSCASNLRYAELDRRLDVSAERFEQVVADLIAELGPDQQASSLRPPEKAKRARKKKAEEGTTVDGGEASAGDPLRLEPLRVAPFQRFHTRGESAPGSLLAAYRSDVSRLPMMNREDEQRLSRRVEFLRRRFEHHQREARLDEKVILCATRCACAQAGLLRAGSCFEGLGALDRRRAADLHALCCEFHDARNEMIERSLHLVLRLLERYRGLGVPTLDLVQEGNASLFKAVEGFDWRRGVRFRTYATYWVNQAFLNLIYNASRTVRVPAYIQKAMKKINDAKVRVGEADPGVEKLAAESKLSADLVRSAMTGNRYSLSLDREIDGQEGTRIVDTVEDTSAVIDTEAMEEISLEEQLAELMTVLNEREKKVLRMRYGLEETRIHTLAEVGEELGVSLERIRQIQEGALDKLRGPRGRRLLAHFAS